MDPIGGKAAQLHALVPSENHQCELVSCQMACPVGTDARGYVKAIARGRFDEAYLIARGPNPLASICGRICAAPCEADCRRGKVPRVDADGCFVANDQPVAIRALKRFACEQSGWEQMSAEQLRVGLCRPIPAQLAKAEEMAALLRAQTAGRFEPAQGEPVAVIGGGPAGLAAAHDLALMGFRPEVFEAEPVAGGMLALGVPAYRLPRELIAAEVAVIEALGVVIHCNTTVGKDVSLAELRRRFAGVVIAVGAKGSRGLELPGERGPGVFGGVDFLRQVSLGTPPPLGHRVVVVGGGNVAYDVARTVLRQITYDVARSAARLSQRPQVCLVSLETLEEMPADTLEIIEGDEEGIERLNGWGPVEIQRDSNGRIQGVLFRRCLRVYDENRRFMPAFDDSIRRLVPCDTVLLAVGQSPDVSFLADGGEDVELTRPGCPKVDPESLATTAAGVFVAGDLAHGTRLLIDAVASGKRAARSVYEYLTGRRIALEATTAYLTLEQFRRERGYEAIRRVAPPTLPPEKRLARPDIVVEQAYSLPQARREASRCLDCAVSPVFDGSRCVLCGGCADVCPTRCLKLVGLEQLTLDEPVEQVIQRALGASVEATQAAAIIKDEDRCIRCGLCAARCPADAITMERALVTVEWSCR
ncbi:hypothetical protein JCM19992_19190 [Thermostilla marina]